MTGTVALVALIVTVLGFAITTAIGLRATTRRPTRGNPHPELARRYVVTAFATSVTGAVAFTTFVIFGVAWIAGALFA